jgi:serine/threonine protein kinase
MVTGRWELKISNYGLDHIKSTQIDIIDPPQLIRKQSSPLLFVDDGSSTEQVAHVIRSTQNLLWMAPESVVATPSNVYLTYPSRQADVYSAGIIINEILTRESPFADHLREHLSPEIIFNQVCEIDLRPRTQPSGQDDFTDGMSAIVSDCLQRNCYARPSFTTIGVRNSLQM